MTPSVFAPSATTSGVPPCWAISSTDSRTSAGNAAALLADESLDALRGAFANLPAVQVDAAQPRLSRERNERRAQVVHVSPAQAVLLLGQHDDAAAFGRFVGQRSKLGRIGQVRTGRRRGAGMNSTAWRLPSVIVPVLSSSSTSTSPAASTARPDMAITLAWIMRSMPAMPIAESRPPIVVGIKHTSSATSTVTVIGLPWPAAVDAVFRKRQQRRADERER